MGRDSIQAAREIQEGRKGLNLRHCFNSLTQRPDAHLLVR